VRAHPPGNTDALACAPHVHEIKAMLNIVSLAIGVFTLPVALVAFFPLLGWLNWFILPLATTGTVIGMLSSHTSGRTLNLMVFGIAVLRLFLGGGIF
jgi:uncharacterized RDD family membrane protein YckC